MGYVPWHTIPVGENPTAMGLLSHSDTSLLPQHTDAATLDAKIGPVNVLFDGNEQYDEFSWKGGVRFLLE